MDEQRAHAATVEINRGMKGEYSIRVVARHDDAATAQSQALLRLALVERSLGIESAWHQVILTPTPKEASHDHDV